MPAREILAQNLPHRAVAVILRDSAGHLVLRNDAGALDFASRGILPAGMASEDFCRRLLHEDWALAAGALRRLGLARPLMANTGAFTYIFEAVIPPAVASRVAATYDNAILVDDIELKSLLSLGYAISPLLSGAVGQ